MLRVLAFGNFALSILAFLFFGHFRFAFSILDLGIFDFGIFDLGFWQLGCRPRISNKVSLNVETKKTRRLKLESDLNVRKKLGRRKQNADLTLKPKKHTPT